MRSSSDTNANSIDVDKIMEANAISSAAAAKQIKGILSHRSRMPGSWLFFRKKRVQFNEREKPFAASKSGKSMTRPKWRMYVTNQFKVLKAERERRPKSLPGASSKSRSSTLTKSSTSNTMKPRKNKRVLRVDPKLFNELYGNQLQFDDESDSDEGRPLRFEIPEPVYKKRKKAPKKSKKQPQKRQKQPQKRQKQPQKSRKQPPKRPRSQPASDSDDDDDDDDDDESYTKGKKGKKPANAFLLFSNRCRKDFRTAINLPEYDNAMVSMVLGKIWRYLSKQERQGFYDEAKALQKAYRVEKEWGIKKTSAEPKRPLNAFLLFCQDHRQEFQQPGNSASCRATANKLANKWRTLKPREKDDYLKRAQAEVAAYRERKGLPPKPYQIDPPPVKIERKTSASSRNSRRKGKNNNKFFTDSSDTDAGSSGTDIQNPSTTAAAALPQSPLARANPPLPPSIPSITIETSDESESEEPPSSQQNPALLTPEAPINSPGVSKLINLLKRRRSRGRKKKRKRWERGEDGLKHFVRDKEERQVHWRDQTSWNVYTPITSVLCDEDICMRLLSSRAGAADNFCFGRCPSVGRYLPALSCTSLYSRQHGTRNSISCLSVREAARMQIDAVLRRSLLKVSDDDVSPESSACVICSHASNLLWSSSDESDLSPLSSFRNAGLTTRPSSPQPPTSLVQMASSPNSASSITPKSALASTSPTYNNPQPAEDEATPHHKMLAAPHHKILIPQKLLMKMCSSRSSSQQERACENFSQDGQNDATLSTNQTGVDSSESNSPSNPTVALLEDDNSKGTTPSHVKQKVNFPKNELEGLRRNSKDCHPNLDTTVLNSFPDQILTDRLDFLSKEVGKESYNPAISILFKNDQLPDGPVAKLSKCKLSHVNVEKSSLNANCPSKYIRSLPKGGIFGPRLKDLPLCSSISDSVLNSWTLRSINIVKANMHVSYSTLQCAKHGHLFKELSTLTANAQDRKMKVSSTLNTIGSTASLKQESKSFQNSEKNSSSKNLIQTAAGCVQESDSSKPANTMGKPEVKLVDFVINLQQTNLGDLFAKDGNFTTLNQMSIPRAILLEADNLSENNSEVLFEQKHSKKGVRFCRMPNFIHDSNIDSNDLKSSAFEEQKVAGCNTEQSQSNNKSSCRNFLVTSVPEKGKDETIVKRLKRKAPNELEVGNSSNNFSHHECSCPKYLVWRC